VRAEPLDVLRRPRETTPDAVDIKPPLSENVDLDFDLNLFLAVSGISSPSAW
jgi:hypothetical protein